MNEVKNIIENDVILVVDDQPANLKIIATVLGGEYTLSIANNGINALKMLEKGKPDLILLDIMMPEMDGYDVILKIKQTESLKDIPVIFLTAKTDIDDIIKGFNYGAVDYITKPFNPTEMKVRVKNHLSLYHAKNEITRMYQELKQSQDSLRTANEKLEQSNREKDKFFSIIAHDLRSPFTSILGLTDILLAELKNFDPEIIEEYIHDIQNSTSQTLRLLENLLEWARMQQGRMEFNPTELKLGHLSAEIMDLYQDNAIQKNISLINHIKDEKVIGDKNMIRTLLRNLVSNAIKFTPNGGRIELMAETGISETIIAVKDNGTGIRKSDMEKLFSITSNYSTTGTNNEEGTGLGLILCREFVEKHHGRIWVESEFGKGSVFKFSLPF